MPDGSPQLPVAAPRPPVPGRALRWLMSVILVVEAAGMVFLAMTLGVFEPFVLMLAGGMGHLPEGRAAVELLVMVLGSLAAPVILALLLLVSAGALALGIGRRLVVGTAIGALGFQVLATLLAQLPVEITQVLVALLQALTLAVALTYLPRPPPRPTA